jgi:hypothetical protein
MVNEDDNWNFVFCSYNKLGSEIIGLIPIKSVQIGPLGKNDLIEIL